MSVFTVKARTIKYNEVPAFHSTIVLFAEPLYIPKGKPDGHSENIHLTKRNIWLVSRGVAKPVFLIHDPTFYLGVQHFNSVLPKPHHSDCMPSININYSC